MTVVTEVTAVIVTSGRQTVKRAVDSVVAQLLQPVELLVVDTSLESSAKSLDLQPEIRILYLPGASLAKARNTAARYAKAPWIWFLDDDDVACIHHLSALAGATGAADVGLVYAANDLLILSSDGWSSVAGFGWAPGSQRLLVLNTILPSASILRAELAQDLFDQRLSVMEDWDAWLTLRHRGATFAWSGRVTVGYVKNDLVGDSMTVAAAHRAEKLLPFAETYERLCARWNAGGVDNLDRDWVRERYREWLQRLASGRRLAVEYYEDAACLLLGPPVAIPCCDLLALVADDQNG